MYGESYYPSFANCIAVVNLLVLPAASRQKQGSSCDNRLIFILVYYFVIYVAIINLLVVPEASRHKQGLSCDNQVKIVSLYYFSQFVWPLSTYWLTQRQAVTNRIQAVLFLVLQPKKSTRPAVKNWVNIVITFFVAQTVLWKL